MLMPARASTIAVRSSMVRVRALAKAIVMRLCEGSLSGSSSMAAPSVPETCSTILRWRQKRSGETVST